MIKLIWFLKRAEHLSRDEFYRWWKEKHAPDVVEAQRPYLKKYVINSKRLEDTLPGRPVGEVDWDGVAEQWYETEADFRAIHERDVVKLTRADTLKHVSGLARIVVEEVEIEVLP